MKRTNLVVSSNFVNIHEETQKIIKDKLKHYVKRVHLFNKNDTTEEILTNLIIKENRISKNLVNGKDLSDYFTNQIQGSSYIDNTSQQICHSKLKALEDQVGDFVCKGKIDIGEKLNLQKISEKPEDFEMKKRLAENCSIINNQINRLHDVNKVMKEITMPKKEKFFMQYNLKNEWSSTKIDLIKKLRHENVQRSKRIQGRSVHKLKKLEEDEKNLLVKQEEQYMDSVKQRSLLSIEKYKISKTRNKLGPMINIQLASKSEKAYNKIVAEKSLEKVNNDIGYELPQIHFPVAFKKSSTYKQVQRAYKQRKEEETRSFSEVRDRIRKMRDYVGDLYLKENLPMIKNSPTAASIKDNSENIEESTKFPDVVKTIQDMDNILNEDKKPEKKTLRTKKTLDLSKSIEKTPEKVTKKNKRYDNIDEVMHSQDKPENLRENVKDLKAVIKKDEKVTNENYIPEITEKKLEKLDTINQSITKTSRPLSQKGPPLKSIDHSKLINIEIS